MSAEFDVALITQPERNAKLTMTKLAETPLHIVLPREHTLASKSVIKLADLRDERLIIYQRRPHPLLYERIMKLMRDENMHPKHISPWIARLGCFIRIWQSLNTESINATAGLSQQLSETSNSFDSIPNFSCIYLCDVTFAAPNSAEAGAREPS
jgi:hypothetical protein